jgi:serine/threonine protein kinase
MVHGMLALHRQGYLHGNLKLENVLVKGDELRLSDFELNGRIRQNCSEEFMVWQFL